MVFWKKKEKDVVDLGMLYERQKKRLAEIREDMPEGSGSSLSSTPSTTSADTSAMGFLGNLAGAASLTETTTESSSSSYPSYGSNESSSTIDEKRRKLAKRLMDITTKLEDLGNQIYHLQQRIELVEKKVSGGY